ncbi:MAG TPA: ROK family protein [Solirubrobacterales bacterium]|nr:ROK family protein [Solirubrobacterales bacterium]
MPPQRRTVARSTDEILRGGEPLDPEGTLTESDWLARRNDKLIPGPAFGDVVGISINRESISWAIAGLGGSIATNRIDASILPVRRNETASPEQIETYVLQALGQIAENLPHDRIGGIGVAWPGPIAPDGEPRDYPHHHSGLRDHDVETLALTPIIERALIGAGLAPGSSGPSGTGTPVRIEVIKDADADMLFELRHGVAKGRRNVMGLKVCGGIGMSIVHAGHIVRGGHGSAGEIQHIQVRYKEADKLSNWGELVGLEELGPCTCSRTDCVGRFANGAAIIDQLANYFGDSNHLTPNERGRRIEEESTHGVVNSVFQRAGSLLGEAMVGPVVAFDPELLVVSAFPRNESLVDGIRTRLKKSHAYLSGEDDVIAGTPNTEGCNTTAMGAARLVIERVFVPTIDRTLPSGGKPLSPGQLSAFLRHQLPDGVADASDYNPAYGKLPPV